MKSLVEIKIPEDYIICCAVNQNGEDKLFSDEIIAFLFSTMNSKWLPLVAYKITFPEDTGEERLYIAYDPRIIDRSRINQMDGEIMKFFHTNLPTVKMEMGGKVKYKIRSRYLKPETIRKITYFSSNSYNQSKSNPVVSIKGKPKESLIDIVENLDSCEKARKGMGIYPIARVHCLYDDNTESFWFTNRAYTPRELSGLLDFGRFVPKYSDVAIKMQKSEVGTSFEYNTKDNIKRLKKHHVHLENQSNLQNHSIALAGDTQKYQYRNIGEFLGALRQNRVDIKEIESKLTELEIKKREKLTPQMRAQITNSIKKYQEEYRILTQQQEDLKNITIYIRKQGEMRYSLIVDPIQTGIMSDNLFDGKTIVINGGPGTGKTTTMIHRLAYLTDTFAIKEDEENKLNKYKISSTQRKQLYEDIKANRDWMFFSPSQMLKEYLAKAMEKEGLTNTSEKVWNWKDYCRMILQENYHLLEMNDSNAPFRVSYLTDPLFYQDSDIINVFTNFYLDQLRGIKSGLPQLSTEGKVYKWTAIAQNIQKKFENSDNLDLAHFVSLFINLESVYSSDCKEILSERSNVLNELAEKICDLLDKNIGAKNSIEEIYELTSEDLVEDYAEADFIDDNDEEAASLINRIQKGIKPLLGKKRNEHPLSGEIQKWLKSYCYYKVSDAKEMTDVHKLIEEILLPVIENKFDGEIQKIGELMIFEQFAQYTRGVRAIMLNVIPSRYKKFRTYLNKTKYVGCDQKLLRELMQRKQGKELHFQEQALLLGFINTLVKLIKATTNKKLSHDYIEAFEEVARPIIGVDEVTDFSKCEIYAMQSLLKSEYNSLTLCGDLMQRMTSYGIQSWKELEEVVSNPKIVEMKKSYRQSKKLLDVARLLFQDVQGKTPNYVAFMKSNKVPAPLIYVDENEIYKIEWISKRISEVYRAYGERLPSIAIFVTYEGYIPQFIERLQETEFFIEKGIKVFNGTNEISSPESHICVYPIDKVKGMEFDVVFFHNIDKSDVNMDLLKRYIYVGVSRAAFFLGVTMNEENHEISRYFVKNKDWFKI